MCSSLPSLSRTHPERFFSVADVVTDVARKQKPSGYTNTSVIRFVTMPTNKMHEEQTLPDPQPESQEYPNNQSETTQTIPEIPDEIANPNDPIHQATDDALRTLIETVSSQAETIRNLDETVRQLETRARLRLPAHLQPRSTRRAPGHQAGSVQGRRIKSLHHQRHQPTQKFHPPTSPTTQRHST